MVEAQVVAKFVGNNHAHLQRATRAETASPYTECFCANVLKVGAVELKQRCVGVEHTWKIYHMNREFNIEKVMAVEVRRLIQQQMMTSL